MCRSSVERGSHRIDRSLVAGVPLCVLPPSRQSRALRDTKPKAATPPKPVARKLLDLTPPDGWEDFWCVLFSARGGFRFLLHCFWGGFLQCLKVFCSAPIPYVWVESHLENNWKLWIVSSEWSELCWSTKHEFSQPVLAPTNVRIHDQSKMVYANI